MTTGLAGDLATTVVGRGRALEVAKLDVGDTVGRYLLVGVLGVGGMGKVFHAYDPKLRRDVALKTVHLGLAEAYTQREAQAMARLSHANVVPVYDVARHEGVLFIAMEFVSGQAMDKWLLDRPRPWKEVIGPFRDAARGLAAAHEAGLIHRDFKPGNVMVGTDGRARVMDFGIARTQRGHGASELSRADQADQAEQADAKSVDALSRPLTRAGAVVGTPAYMAPEHMRGKELDASADQYSYCVALYEALFGARPFHGAAEELLRAKESVPVEIPSDAVPAWLSAIVVRGLAPRPADRWPSMNALIAALDRGSQQRRRRWIWSVVGSTGALLVGVIAVWALERPTPCAGDRLDEIWSPSRRAEVSSALEMRDGRSGGAAAGVLAALDRWADTWHAAHRDACEDTVVRGEQSATVMDRRMGCLQRGLVGFRTTVDLLGPEATPAVLDRATEMAFKLPTLRECNDLESLLSSVVPPSPELAPRVDTVRAQIQEIRVRDTAGTLPDLREVDAVIERAEATAYEPLVAEAVHLRGTLGSAHENPERAARDLKRAFLLARGRDYDRVAIAAAMDLGFLLGWVERDTETGLRWISRAQAEIANAGTPEHHAILHRYRGLLLTDKGDLAGARVELDTAVTQTRSLDDADPFLLASVLNDRAILANKAGETRASADLWREALNIGARARGENHPTVVAMRGNLAICQRQLGDLEDARRLLLDTKAANEALYGNDSVAVHRVLLNLSNVEVDAEHMDAALDYATQAVEMVDGLRPPGHPDRANARVYLGMALVAAGRLDEGIAALEAALAGFGEERDADVAHVWIELGRARLLHGESARALEDLAQALQIDAVGHSDLLWRQAQLYRARGELELHKPDAALRRLALIIPMFDPRNRREAQSRALAQTTLARALGAMNEDAVGQERAIAAARPFARQRGRIPRELRADLDTLGVAHDATELR